MTINKIAYNGLTQATVKIKSAEGSFMQTELPIDGRVISDIQITNDYSQYVSVQRYGGSYFGINTLAQIDSTDPMPITLHIVSSTYEDFDFTLNLVPTSKQIQEFDVMGIDRVSVGDTGRNLNVLLFSGDGTISYSVAPGYEEYIDINPVTGAITAKKAGLAYFIVTASETDEFAETLKYRQVTLVEDSRQQQIITASDITASYGDVGLKLNASTNGNGALRYMVKSGYDVLYVDDNGNITASGTGTAVITITAEETDTFRAATKDVTVTINKGVYTGLNELTVPISASKYSNTSINMPFSYNDVRDAQVTNNYSDYISISAYSNYVNIDTNAQIESTDPMTVTIHYTSDGYEDFDFTLILVPTTKDIPYLQVWDAPQTLEVGQTSGAFNDVMNGGDGTISYSVLPGYEEYISIDPATGAITAKKAGKAYYCVTASETENYAENSVTMMITIVGGEPEPSHEAGYYIVGTMTDWQIDDAYLLTENTQADTTEFMFTELTLSATDQIKIVKYEPGEDMAWYPDGMDNSYKITADGNYDVYFRPNGDGGDEWFHSTIRVTPTAYTITWKNDDGSLIDTTQVGYGTVPTHDDPTKAEDDENTYTFSGWTPEVVAVTGDATYTAQFTAVPKEVKYTVTWKNGDGTTLKTDTVDKDTAPAYSGNVPEKAEDENFTYYFSGWTDGTNTYGATDTLPAVTGDITYTATFDAVAKFEEGYYLVGTFTSWKVDPAYQLAANPAAEGEYMITQVALTATDGFKVVYAKPGEAFVWYPDGVGNDISVENNDKYNIYFRPDGIDDEAWDYGVIFVERYVPAESTEAINAINALPTEVTLADAEQIDAARQAYEALNDEQKGYIDADTLKKLTDAEAALAAAIDQEAADDVDDMIDSLPDEITLADKTAVEAARQAYDALTDAQKNLIAPETYEVLTDAEDAIAALEVTSLIEALPAEITLADKTDVEAARTAYNALTDDQKELVDDETLNKLTAAETVIADREAAAAVEALIDALPEQITSENIQTFTNVSFAYMSLSYTQFEYLSVEAMDKANNAFTAVFLVSSIDQLPEEITLDDKQLVTDLRSAYDDTNDDVKALISDEYMNKLVSAEQTIANLEAAKAVENQINALPAEVTLADKTNVEAARAAYDALTDDQKELIDLPTLTLLTNAEERIADLEAAAAVEALINALPAAADVAITDANDIIAARQAYDALTEPQKFLIDSETYMKQVDAELASQQIADDVNAVSGVVTQIEDLPAASDVTLADEMTINSAIMAYDMLTDSQKAMFPEQALKKLTDAEAALADLKAAGAVETLINALPGEITIYDKQDVESAREAYDALTDDQKALVDADTLQKLTDAEAAIADLEAAGAVEALIDALPAEITLADKTDVEAAREAYDALTDAQKALIEAETLAILTDAEAAIADLEAAGAVETLIYALPAEITLEDKTDVEAAREAYDALTDDQKDQIDADTLAKLTDAEAVIADLEAAAAVETLINALPAEITLEDKTDVEAARQAYDALTDDQKAIIDDDTVKKLTDAETALAAAEKAAADQAAADAVVDAFNALPTDVTVDDKDTIEAARAAYDALTADQKALVDADTLAKLTDAEAAYDALPLFGDVDGDGKVDIFDVSAIQKSLAGVKDYPNYNKMDKNDIAFRIADIDGDGKVDIFDASLLQKWIAGDAAAQELGIGAKF